MVVGSLVNGGVERVLVNIACGLNQNLFKVYIYCIDSKGAIYKEALEEHGICVVEHEIERKKVSPGNKHAVLYRSLRKFIQEHSGITVLHNHSGNHSIEVLLASKRSNIPVICEHSHAAYSKYWNPKLFPWKSKIVSKLSNFITKRIPNYKIGCSKAACRRIFGTTRNQYFIPNGVNYNVFNPNGISSKLKLREKYDLEECAVYFIFVGRFVEPKNPLFMLEVFGYLAKYIKNCRLLLVGYGEMEEAIRKKIRELDIMKFVRFFPPESNVPELLKASDYFITPSIYEGLGITFVEAQLMGIPAFASDQVPREADLGMCEFIPLDGGSKAYAEYVLDYIETNKLKEKKLLQDLVDMYDMERVIRAYECIYQNKRSEVEQYRI